MVTQKFMNRGLRDCILGEIDKRTQKHLYDWSQFLRYEVKLKLKDYGWKII